MPSLARLAKLGKPYARAMHLGEYHKELQALARKRLTGLGLDLKFTEDQLYEISYLLANDVLVAIDNGIDKYTDLEWRKENKAGK